MAPSLEPPTSTATTTEKSTKEDTTLTLRSANAGPHGKEGMTALEAISQGIVLPGIPSFTSIEKQRHWILEHMAGAFRVFARKGYTEGMAGHISVRDPEDPHTFWTNP